MMMTVSSCGLDYDRPV